MSAFKSTQHEKAYRLGEASIGDRKAECPYALDSELGDEWCIGRDNAEVEAGEAMADSLDPSMRDVYDPAG